MSRKHKNYQSILKSSLPNELKP